MGLLSQSHVSLTSCNVVAAHELGHRLGLADLYGDGSSASRVDNTDKLMFWSTGTTATDVTDADEKGARYITGQHTGDEHNFINPRHLFMMQMDTRFHAPYVLA